MARPDKAPVDLLWKHQLRRENETLNAQLTKLHAASTALAANLQTSDRKLAVVEKKLSSLESMLQSLLSANLAKGIEVLKTEMEEAKSDIKVLGKKLDMTAEKLEEVARQAGNAEESREGDNRRMREILKGCDERLGELSKEWEVCRSMAATTQIVPESFVLETNTSNLQHQDSQIADSQATTQGELLGVMDIPARKAEPLTVPDVRKSTKSEALKGFCMNATPVPPKSLSTKRSHKVDRKRKNASPSKLILKTPRTRASEMANGVSTHLQNTVPPTTDNHAKPPGIVRAKNTEENEANTKRILRERRNAVPSRKVDEYLDFDWDF